MVSVGGAGGPVWGNQMQTTPFNPAKPAAQQTRPDQSSQTDGVQVRITPANFRDVLGPQSDVLLTPQNMKDLYEKGYLDVQKSRTVMESNEGTFTILAKAFAAFVAPSRSLGAITIDPNFMEMIKDPNAKIGFGYTRVENQSINVLASPAVPPGPEKATPPAPPYLPPTGPGSIQPHTPPGKEVQQEWNPVEMTRVQLQKLPPKPDIKARALGTFDHDSAHFSSNTNSTAVVNALGTGVRDGAFTVQFVTNSNILRPTNKPDYNNEPNAGLSRIRKDGMTATLKAPPGTVTAGQNGDFEHRDVLRDSFGLETTSRITKNGNNKLTVTPVTGPNAPSEKFAGAAQALIDTYSKPDKNGKLQFPVKYDGISTRSALQSEQDILVKDPKDPSKMIPNPANPYAKMVGDIAKKRGLSPEDTTKLYQYAQSFVDHRSFEAKVDIQPENLPKVQAWLEANKPPSPVATSQIYKDIQAQVANITASGTATGSAAASPIAAVQSNFNTVKNTPPAVDATGKPVVVYKTDVMQVQQQVRELLNGSPKPKGAELEQLQGLDQQLTELVKKTPTEAEARQSLLVKNLSDAAHPGTIIDNNDSKVLDAQVQALGGPDAKPAGEITINGTKYPMTRTDNTTTPPTQKKIETWGQIVADVKATAAQKVVVPGDGPGTYDPKDMEPQMQSFEGLVKDMDEGKRVNPQTIANYAAGVKDNLAKLPESPEKTALQARYDKLLANPNVVKALETVKSQDIADAAAGKKPTPPNPIGDVTKSLGEFHNYVKAVIADGKVDFEERKGLNNYVGGVAANMVATLKAHGIEPVGATDQAKLAVVTPEMVQNAKPPFSAEEVDGMVKNLESIKGAQAAINLSSEGAYTSSLYQNVRQLDQKLNEFEQIGVIKTAFRGEMKALAEQKPEHFNALMHAVYGLPPCPSDDKGPNKALFDAYKGLREQAQNGTLTMPPNVTFVDRAQLGGGNGAYARPAGPGAEPVILLARDLMDQPDKMMEVFTEEMGHHLEHSASVQALEAQNPQNQATLKKLQGQVDGARTAVNTADAALRTALKVEPGKPIPPATPNEPAPVKELRGKLEQADKGLKAAQQELSTYQATPLDAQGDEGRAFLYALQSIRGNQGVAAVGSAAARGRNEELVVDASGQITRASQKDKELFDQGVVAKDIVVGGKTVVTKDTRMEFSSTPVQSPEARRSQAAAPGYSPQIAGLNPYASQTRTMQGPSTDFQTNVAKLQGFQAQIKANPTPDPAQDLEVANVVGALQDQAKGLSEQQQGLKTKLETLKAATPPDLKQIAQVQGQLDQIQSDFTKAEAVLSDPGIVAANSRGQAAVPVQARNSGFGGGSELADNFAPIGQTPDGQPLPPVQAAYDEKPGKFTEIAKGMMDVVPQGMKSFGQLLVQTAENWQKQIKQLFASMLKPVSIAEETIYGGAGPWDNDVEVGRKNQNYEAGQTNLRFKESTPTGGAPDYHRNSREANERQQAARAQQQRQGPQEPGTQRAQSTVRSTTTRG